MFRIRPFFPLLLALLLTGLFAAPTRAQDESEELADKGLKETAKEVVEETRSAAEEVAKTVDESEAAHEAMTEVLKPIYRLAEYLAFPAFHWVAFAAMVAGVVSFALQLVFAKLAVLSRASFSLMEILSDALGLVISLIGLVLTTQAAAENSNFTTSPAAVLSATGVGVLAGLIFYWCGQKLELQAADGRRASKN